MRLNPCLRDPAYCTVAGKAESALLQVVVPPLKAGKGILSKYSDLEEALDASWEQQLAGGSDSDSSQILHLHRSKRRLGAHMYAQEICTKIVTGLQTAVASFAGNMMAESPGLGCR